MEKPNRFATKIPAAIVLSVLLFGWTVFGWRPTPSICGQLKARIDVSRGHYNELGYGFPFRGASQYGRILRQRYGIEFRYVGFCTVSRYRVDYADAYEIVSTAAAKRKFGRDVFKEAYEEAVKNSTQAVATTK